MKIRLLLPALLLALLTLLTLLTGCGSDAPNRDSTGNAAPALSCTLEVRCDELLTRLDQLEPEKAAIVPPDGWILPQTEVTFQQGDSAFDVFRKVMRERKIHFEYVDATVYSSAYVEGIANLYEFDCGPQSGWIYHINGVQPGLSCSEYTLSAGDQVVFFYTCERGSAQ